MLFTALEIIRRVSPRSSATQAAGRNHPVSSKIGTFTALHRDPCRETAHGRMVLPSVLPAVRLFPRLFLKSNIHLQFLGYRNCKIFYSVKYPRVSHADGDRGIRAVTWHTRVSDRFCGHIMRRCFQSNREVGTAAHQHKKLLQRDSCEYEEDAV